MTDFVPLEKAAELEGVTYAALLKRCARRRIILANDSRDGRRKLFPASALSLAASRKLQEESVLAALQKRPSESAAIAAPDSQSKMGFIMPGELEGRLVSAAPPWVSKKQRGYVLKLARIIGDCANGTWKKSRGETIAGIAIHSRRDYICATAKQEEISTSTIYAKLAIKRRIDADPGIPPEQKDREFMARVLPGAHPGKSAFSFFADPENAWMREKLLSVYLTQARYSVKRAWELLLLEIDAKQRAWGAGHIYQRPTLRQCRTMLSHVPEAVKKLGREGEKAYNDRCAPYISRNPDSLRANDIWVTDQKQIDVRLRGAGEQLGRIWMVSFMDARSWKVMGYWFGPILSSDMVMDAAAMAIARHGAPKAILMDLGKEFACTAFSGSFRKIKGETLMRETQGLCQRMGIDVIKAIGRNPQTKPIERWHNVASEFDKNIPGWCGHNTTERPEVLAALEHQHEEWKQTGRGGSPLWTIYQYLYAFVNWVENDWNAKHRGRGKYLRGMTPNECWNTHLPSEGLRRPSQAEVDSAAADHRVLKVARGGQINITVYGQTIEYQAPELFLRQGEELEVVLNRRSLAKIAVLDKGGQPLCEAAAKPLFHWGAKTPESREELRQMIRVRNAARKAVSLGNAARRVLEVTATPVEIGPQHPPIREISSLEFKSRKMRVMKAPKTMTAGDLARKIFEMES